MATAIRLTAMWYAFCATCPREVEGPQLRGARATQGWGPVDVRPRRDHACFGVAAARRSERWQRRMRTFAVRQSTGPRSRAVAGGVGAGAGPAAAVGRDRRWPAGTASAKTSARCGKIERAAPGPASDWSAPARDDSAPRPRRPRPPLGARARPTACAAAAAPTRSRVGRAPTGSPPGPAATASTAGTATGTWSIVAAAATGSRSTGSTSPAAASGCSARRHRGPRCGRTIARSTRRPSPRPGAGRSPRTRPRPRRGSLWGRVECETASRSS